MNTFYHRTNKNKTQNQSLVPYLTGPASKQSKSSLHKVREFVDDRKFLTNWEIVNHEGWALPATKEKHDWCGLWQTFGCLNSKEHQRLGKGNMIYVKHIKDHVTDHPARNVTLNGLQDRQMHLLEE